MRMQFLLRALSPHLLLALVVLGLCQFPKSVEAAAALAAAVAAAHLLCWYGTDLLVTGRVPGERMIRESKPYVGSDGQLTKEPELAAWLLLAAAFYFLDWAVLSAPPAGSVPGVCIFLGIDAGLLAAALCWSDAYGAFTRHVRPRLEREREEGERRRREQDAEARRRGVVRAARNEAQRYFDAHKDVLGDAYPEALFHSSLNAGIPETSDPAAAWQAARDLIEKLRPLVAQALEAGRLEEERRATEEEAARRRQIDADALQARIAALAGRDDDEAADEMLELQRRLARLQGPQQRRTIAPDDL